MCSNLLKKEKKINEVTKTQRTILDVFDVVHLASQKLCTRTIETPCRQHHVEVVLHCCPHCWGREEKINNNVLEKCEEFWI